MTRRFFFHFDDGDTIAEDDVGLELGNGEQAYLEAVACAREMWPGLMAERLDPTRCAFEITDDGGALLFRLEFSELMEVCRTVPPRPPGKSEIERAVAETYQRAEEAKQGLRAGFAEVRQLLDESTSLIAQLARFQQSGAR